MKLIDLSHVITPGEAGSECSVTRNAAADNTPWYIVHDVCLHSHGGTHVETPYHVNAAGGDLSDVALDRLCGAAVLLKIGDAPRGGEISAAALEEAAVQAGGVRHGDIVLCDLGNAGYYGTPEYAEAPRFSREAMELLVSWGVKALAVDSTSIDMPGASQSHYEVLLENDIPVIENAANLSSLSQPRMTVYAFPVAIRGVEAFPVRLVAQEDEAQPMSY